jgi:alpha-glucosidase
MTPWWNSAVIYQVYPRSFQDSNGDGVGDLPGLLKRLDYLAWLGIDAVWISPFYPSPMADFGYDVSNYTDVDSLFGTLADFDAVLAAAHRLGLKVILDFVPNHTSDQHPWFIDSRLSRDNPKRDWYIWRDPKPDGSPPNNWQSEFGGPAWTLDPTTGQYFYHAYLSRQPDLNWRNPDVRAAIANALRFWLDRGVDGFRLDTIEHLLEDEQLRDNPANPAWTVDQATIHKFKRTYTTDQPDIAQALQGLRKVVDDYNNRILIGETYLPLERVVAYADYGIHMPFNFQLITTPWKADAVAALITQYERLLGPTAWPNWVLGNHDRKRIAHRVGAEQAFVAAMLLLTLRGTPTLYYGDELGLANVHVPPDQVQDPWEKNLPGQGLGRDPVRTPMAWDTNENADFTTGKTWLPLHDDWTTRNVAVQQSRPHSMLNFYRTLMDLRRTLPALTSGAYGRITAHGNALVFDRRNDSQSILVALNFGNTDQTVPLPAAGACLLSTHMDRTECFMAGPQKLRANEGVVIIQD